MPRRNLHLLLAILLVSVICYQKADSASRLRYGTMARTVIQVMKEVDRHYVEEVEPRAMFEGALEGLVSRLDEYSAYIPPAESTQFREGLEQQFGGIGIEVAIDPQSGLLTVLSPIPGTPAWRAGLQAGDKIVGINGEAAEGLTLDDAVRRMRGAVGTAVRVTLLRGTEQRLEVELVREVIQIQSVLGDARDADGRWQYVLEEDPRLGYIRIVSFGERTLDDLRAALDQINQQSVKGLILDLRGNAGGLLDGAVAVCDLFLKQGRIVSTRGRDGRDREVYNASGSAPYADLPLVVLVNRYSASASEIVAACLQDHRRAAIVGERTWGKGTVQNLIPLEGGRSLLKLTTARYFRPSNRNIHRTRNATEADAWGVMPDEGCLVVLSDEQMREMIQARHNRDMPRPANGATGPPPVRDPQLARAVARLHEMLKQDSGLAQKRN
jgi:carboxyl-terminal processing protease